MTTKENQGTPSGRTAEPEGDTGVTLMEVLMTFCYKTMFIPADFINAFFIRSLV